ncbi:ABC transporter permease [Pseudonocardia sp. RS11V-5]|uniref:ABC transporter permease n=1 Tax=Pseudonocardia terrae TaxID=2905831 RepID=UPI001E4137F9|nr:ABC transporter permease [Pseudonocardia terrae]MCE3552850.1 ABC transporter permease [Pseudonocardia terrae]
MTMLDDRNGPRDPAPQLKAPAPKDVDLGFSAITTRIRNGFEEAGDIGRFTADTVKDFPDMFRRYVPEVFRQAGVMIFSSALIIWFMMFIMGGQCGLEASYTLKQIGAPLYSAVFDAYCGLRELSVYMWGWILAAKVGCGFVAEIGSMRIADEVDAMEVMGIKSKSYLVGTRIAATIIAVPFMYAVGLAILYCAMYLITVVNLGGVSPGGFLYLFWLYQSPYDSFAVMCKIMAESIVIVGVGLYYGYNARGGPVGVGRATAKSMIINLVLISVIGTIGTLAFWGLDANSPIAN